jgi:HK97 family phage prohead protease
MTTDSFDSPQGQTHSMHLRATESSPETAGDRTLRFVASDETPDRVGDIIKVSGWNLTSYKKNPVVLWGHDTSTVPPIGRATNVRRGKKPNGERALLADIEFAPEEAHPFAETVYQLAKRGYLNAVSVGFIPKATKELTDKEKAALGMEPYGQLYSQADLLEISVVSVPANPSALVSATRSLVTEGVVGERQVKRFLEHVTDGAEPDLAERLKSKIRGFVDLGVADRSPACRQDGETQEESVERKIPELVEEGMEQEQAVAEAAGVCEAACSEKAAPNDEVVETSLADALSNAAVDADVAKVKHIAKVEETEETYVITYLKPGVMELGYKDDDDEEDDDKKKGFLARAIGLLAEAQAEQARSMTTLTDSISDLTKRLDIAAGGSRAGVSAPEAPAPDPVPAVSSEEVEAVVRRVSEGLLQRLKERK